MSAELPGRRRSSENGDDVGGRTTKGARIAPVAGRRNLRLAWMAAGLLVVSALGVQWRVASAGERVRLLALAHPVSAGHVLSASDLTEVAVPPGSGVAGIPADEESSLVGRRVAVSLWAGAPLSRAALADPAPAPGVQVTGLLVKEGHYPAQLAAGDSVVVYDRGSDSPATQTGGASSAASTASSPPQGLVLSVLPASEPGEVVVTVQASPADAAQMAQVTEPQLALTAPDGR
ncbi:SAF domain-containing protein [Streptacidiphilus sp. MAP5-3]|uniref:SAF domain-containing protein n=1 Tax=unclassified Streptacidiphilus TaxID=2643834 RepID=UPI003519C074